MKKRPNVILITIDSLRADHCGFMGYEKKITPNIDALAKESIVFTQAFANAPMTAQSLISLSTSTYPLDYQGPKKIEKPRILVSEVFKKEDYTTAVFTSNAYMSNFFGYNKGWDFFECFSKSPSEKERRNRIFFILEEISLLFFPLFLFLIKYIEYKKARKELDFSETKFWKKPPDSLLTQTLKDFISSTNRKSFFCWVHYGAPHIPYLPLKIYLNNFPLSFSEVVAISLPHHFSSHWNRKKLKKILTKRIKDIKELYDQAIQYEDLQIKNLINFLKKEKLYENTIIILTADHGEEFLEHGQMTHPPQLYNELLHVPLLMRIPEKKPQKINKKVSLIDLFPSLLKILEISLPDSFKGKNFFTQEAEVILFHQTAFNEKKEGAFKYTEIESLKQCKIACQNEEWKYILSYENSREELYNLLRDPQEKNNLISKEKETAAKMRKRIEKFIQKNPPLSSL